MAWRLHTFSSSFYLFFVRTKIYAVSMRCKKNV
jgi:hypothetical protein